MLLTKRCQSSFISSYPVPGISSDRDRTVQVTGIAVFVEEDQKSYVKAVCFLPLCTLMLRSVWNRALFLMALSTKIQLLCV